MKIKGEWLQWRVKLWCEFTELTGVSQGVLYERDRTLGLFLMPTILQTQIHGRVKIYCGCSQTLKSADFLPLLAPAKGFPFQRHIETKSEDGNQLSITNETVEKPFSIVNGWFSGVP
jgi:hypothetical protein